MDKEILQLDSNRNSSSQSVSCSEDGEHSNDDQYRQRIMLMNIQRHDVPANLVTQSEPDGVAASLLTNPPKIAATMGIPGQVGPLTQYESGPGFSHHAYCRNQRFATLQRSDPALHRVVSSMLQQERDELISKQPHGLKTALRIWVISGVLEHGLEMGLLERIATRYALIKVVPIGYHQTELYQNEIVIARPQND